MDVHREYVFDDQNRVIAITEKYPDDCTYTRTIDLGPNCSKIGLMALLRRLINKIRRGHAPNPLILPPDVLALES